MHHLLEIWFGWVLSGGYVGIIILMAMGSTPLPVPAEAVLPPAAFLAAQGKLNPVGVILAGTLGAYLGAAFMYWISRWIGRPLVLRFGRFILLTPNKQKTGSIDMKPAEFFLRGFCQSSVISFPSRPGSFG